MLGELQPVADAEEVLQSFQPSIYLEDATELPKQAREATDAFDSYVDERDWAGLIDEAAEMVDVGTRRLHKLMRGRRTLNEVAGAARTLQTHLATFDEGSGTSNRKEIISFLREINQRSNLQIIPDRVPEALEKGEGDVLTLDGARAIGVPAYAGMIARQRDLAIWYVVAGYLTYGEVASYRAIDGAEPTHHPVSTLERVEDEIETIHRESRDRLRAIYSALASGSWGRLEARSLGATSYPRTVIHELEARARTLREGRLYESEVDGNPGQEAAFARAEVELHRTLHLLGLLLGAGHRYRFLAARSDVEDGPQEAAQSAVDKGFESLVRDGVNVDLDDLVADPEAYDERLVEVEGFVENVRYDADEATTRFDLVDRLHDVRVPAFYPFRNLTAWHLRSGGYLHGHMHFEASSDYAGGPELQVDEVSVGGNSDQSWFDELVHEFATKGFIHVHPSRANVLWTFEPPSSHGGDHE